MGCGGAIGNFFASFDDMVHNTIESTISQAKFYITHPLEAIEVAALMYVGVPPTVAMSTTSYANGHGSIQQVGISVVQAYASANMGGDLMTNVLTSASASAATAAIQGKPLDQVLKAGFTGSVQGLVMNQFRDFAAENNMTFDPKDLSTQVITNAVNGATTAIINGKSIGDAIAKSTANSLTTYGLQQASTAVGDIWGEIYEKSETLQEIGNAYNELRGEATKTWDELQRNIGGANSIYANVKLMFDQATYYTDMTNRHVAGYEEEKFNSTHIDEWLTKIAPEQFRTKTYDDGEGGSYTRFEEKKSWTDDDGNPVWQGVDDDFRFEGQTKDQLKANRERLAAAHATNASSTANVAKIYSDAYVGQVDQYNGFVDRYITTVSNKFDTQTNKLKELETTANNLNSETQKLATDLADKLKSYEELEAKYGKELAEQIAAEAAKTIKADQEAKAAEEERIRKIAEAQEAEDRAIAEDKAAKDLAKKQEEEAKALADKHAEEKRLAEELAAKEAQEAKTREEKKAAEEAAAKAAEELKAKQAEEAKALADKQAAEEAERIRLAEEATKESERIRLAAEEAERVRLADEAERRRLAEEVKPVTPVTPVTPAGPQIGDMSDAAPGTKVTLADGTIGVVSNSGKIVPEGTVSDLTPVVNPTVTTGPVEPKEEPTDVTPEPKDTDVIPDDVERQPDGTLLDPKTGIRYLINDDGTVTTIEPTDETETLEPVIDPPGPDVKPTTWTPPSGAIKNSDGTYTVTNDDGSTITYDKDGNTIGATEATDTKEPIVEPPGPVVEPPGPVKPFDPWDNPEVDPPFDPWDNPEEPPESEEEEPPPESTPEEKYNFYLKKGVPELTARTKSGFTPKVPPVTPVKPVTPTPVKPVTPVKPPIVTLPPITPPPPPPVKPTTPTPPPVQYNNNWYMLASLLGAPDLAAQVYNQIPMQKGGLATLKPKKHGLASLTTQNRRSK